MNPFAKAWLGARATIAFLRLVRNPSKLDEVFRILDSLENSKDATMIVNEFHGNPAHAKAFQVRPRVGSLNLNELLAYPPGSLGRTFAEEMKARNLNPADIERRDDDGTPPGYVFAHLRETHDIWHTVTGFDVDVAGELGLQAFYLTQFRAMLAVLILALGLLNTFFFAPEDRARRMDEIARGWQMGRKARSLFGYDWANNWAKPLDTVRAELGIQMHQGAPQLHAAA